MKAPIYENEKLATDRRFFDNEYAIVDKQFDELRDKLLLYFKPIIERKALELNIPLINTQYSLSTRHDEYETPEFNAFHEFLNHLEDDFKLAFYFEVYRKKFRWLILFPGDKGYND